MTKDEISYKDLSKLQLENLKDIYVETRISKMLEEDLRKFVRTSIDDQIKGTVGNEEEREAWNEMKEHFQDDLSAKIIEIDVERRSLQTELQESQGRRNEASKKISSFFQREWKARH